MSEPAPASAGAHWADLARVAPPLLVVVSGPSGVGKDALLQAIRLSSHGARMHFVVTATTRPKRAGERDGGDYHFLSEARFEALLAEDGFVEHALVYGYRYGVPRDEVETPLARGEDVIMRVDVQGVRHLRERYPEAVKIFLAPPDLGSLERRLRGRKSDGDEVVRRRLEVARHEMDELPRFDYAIINRDGELDQAVDAVLAVIIAEKHRVARVLGRG